MSAAALLTVQRNLPSDDGRELKELSYPNGDKYVGECAHSKRDGRGIFYFKDGARYEGDYKDGKKHGKGMFVFVNGDKLLGRWEAGAFSGHGMMSYDNGDSYEGEFNEEFVLHGSGTYTHSCGDRYIGSFLNGARSGRGKLIKQTANAAAPDIYEGDWDANEMQGRGVYRYGDGDYYEGEILHGRPHGAGTFVRRTDGKRFAGQFLHGAFLQAPPPAAATDDNKSAPEGRT